MWALLRQCSDPSVAPLVPFVETKAGQRAAGR